MQPLLNRAELLSLLQDLDAVEALIQGLLVFQGGVLMVRPDGTAYLHLALLARCSFGDMLVRIVFVCVDDDGAGGVGFAGESR